MKRNLLTTDALLQLLKDLRINTAERAIARTNESSQLDRTREGCVPPPPPPLPQDQSITAAGPPSRKETAHPAQPAEELCQTLPELKGSDKAPTCEQQPEQ